MDITILKNGTIVDEFQIESADLVMGDGKILGRCAPGRAESLFSMANADVVDVTNKLVLPGILDTHVHMREPGLEHKEDFATGTRAAACGGVTTIVDMPNTKPPVSTADALVAKAERLSKNAYVDFGLYGVISDENINRIAELAEAGVLAYKIFLGPTTGNIQAPATGQLFTAFEAVAQTGLPMTVHAEDRDTIDFWEDRVTRQNDVEYEDFLRSRPRYGEVVATQLCVSLAQATGARTHIVHVSIAEALEVIAGARAQGVPLTAETCPPYLFHTKDDYRTLGAILKVLPPVRAKSDQNRLWGALHQGVLDMVATDHAPHTMDEKTLPIMKAPGGTIGVETLLPLFLNEAAEGRITLHELVKWISAEPARIFGLYPDKGSLKVGTDADVVVVDPNFRWVVDRDGLHSKSKNTSLHGRALTGQPVATYLRGQLIMKDGETKTGPQGRLLLP